MSWLARLDIGAEVAHREGVRDSYGWHQKLWQCFPGTPDKERDFLTRIDLLDGGYRLWVLGRSKPQRPIWCLADGFALREIAPSFLSHRYYNFDLRANPVRSVVQRGPNGETLYKANGKRKPGKRVPLVNPDELCYWLVRKGETKCLDQKTGQNVPGGFRIVEERPLEISPMVESHFRKKGQAGYHGGVQFRGTLEVTDRERFIDTYYSGIGSAKSFGFGLLLLAPVTI